MMESYYKRDTCRLCKSKNLERILDMAPTPIGDDFIASDRLDQVQEEYPLNLNLCLDCGLLQLANVLNPEMIYREYLYETCISLGLQKHFREYVNSVMHRRNPKKGSLVIDIGSNDGTVLRYFKEYGMNVLGVEPAEKIAEKVTASGIKTIPQFFTVKLARSIKQDHGAAAIVTANNIFANVDDLDEFITGVKELLADDGVFIFETGYMIDLIQNTVPDNINHDHLCYFSIHPLVNYFKNNGLEMIDVERVSTKGGSIRCTVQLDGGKQAVSRSVAELMTLETELGFDHLIPYQMFVQRLKTVKEQLLTRLRDIRTQGKSIACYGAAVGVTTLSYYFGLKEYIDYFVDDNPIKYNLYSPGWHIPVLPSDVIYKRKPDYIIILPWRYANPIINKHQKYLEQNGQFIKVLPAVEVISLTHQHALSAQT